MVGAAIIVADQIAVDAVVEATTKSVQGSIGGAEVKNLGCAEVLEREAEDFAVHSRHEIAPGAVGETAREARRSAGEVAIEVHDRDTPLGAPPGVDVDSRNLVLLVRDSEDVAVVIEASHEAHQVSILPRDVPVLHVVDVAQADAHQVAMESVRV